MSDLSPAARQPLTCTGNSGKDPLWQESRTFPVDLKPWFKLYVDDMEEQQVSRSISSEAGRQRMQRTGPIGRLARLALAAGLGWIAYDLWINRTGVFESTGPLDEPFVLILALLVVYAVHDLANMIGWGRRALAILAAVVVALVGVTLVAGEALWAPPFTWLLWGLGFAGLISVVVFLLMAVIAGTPGCELAVLRDIAGRQPSQPDDKPMFCLAGLHAIDAWERRRSWHPES